MYTSPYGLGGPPFRLPPHYGGSVFQNSSTSPPHVSASEASWNQLLQRPEALLKGSLPEPGTQSFDELFLLGLIILLSGSERGKEIIPILALLLFCGRAG